MTTLPRSGSDLVDGLRRLGIQDGDAVVVHSSLRALGPVDGRAETVVTALLDVTGERGTLLVPTYTYFTTRFDPRSEPSLTGRLTETIRNRKDAHRSWHPTHSVAAIGADAAKVVENHHLKPACGFGSPMDQMVTRNGWVLLIGVGHSANSTIHVGEVHAAVPHLDVPFFADSPTEATVVTPSGSVNVPIIHPSGCSKAFGAVERPMRQRGAIRDGILGSALVQLMRGRVLVETVVEMLTANPGELLCSDPACHRCTESRKLVVAGGAR
jgi:aminoglycoside 3-N-acetyltransferase